MKNYRDIVGDGGSDVAGQVAEQQVRLQQRMALVKHIIAVASGKGGVGKSSVTVNVASALALNGHTVGILDADINGSSIPKMAGVRRQPLRRGAHGMIPPSNDLGMKIISIDLLLHDDNQPVQWNATTQRDAFTWRGMVEMGAIREFLADTEWGELDYLFIDLPPGTDKLPNIVDLLPRISGTVIVTIPSRVSQFVVGKSIHMAKHVLKTPIIGLVENMSTRVCSHCGESEDLFPDGNVEILAKHEEVPYLGAIPFDPRLAAAADEETLFMSDYNETPAGRAIEQLASAVTATVDAQQVRSAPQTDASSGSATI